MSFSLINSAARQSTNDLDVTTLAKDMTGANLFVLVLSNYQPGPVPTIADSKTNIWLPLATYETSGQTRVKMYYVENPVTDVAQTYSASSVTTNYPSIYVAAFAGAAQSPFGSENGLAFDLGGSGVRNPGSVAATENDQLFVTGCSVLAPGVSISGVDSGFTFLGFLNGDTHSIGIGLAYKIQTSAASEDPGWTPTGVTFVQPNQASFKSDPPRRFLLRR